MFLAAQDMHLTDERYGDGFISVPVIFTTRQSASNYDIKIRCDLVAPFLHVNRSDICTIRSSVGY